MKGRPKSKKRGTGISLQLDLAGEKAPLHVRKEGAGTFVQSQLVPPTRQPGKKQQPLSALAWGLQSTADELLARVDEYTAAKHREANALGELTESEEALDYLYQVTRHICQQLERLAAEPRTSPLLKRYGKDTPGWPCLIGLTPKGEIARLFRLQGYLEQVGNPSIKGEQDLLFFERTTASRGGYASPFQIASRELHKFVLTVQKDSKAFSEKPTPWLKAVCKLPPLNRSSAGDWWKLMKILLDEQWPTNEKLYALAAHLPTGKGHQVPRARAIGNSFRSAFITYAKSPKAASFS